jgi:hypothetical protein
MKNMKNMNKHLIKIIFEYVDNKLVYLSELEKMTNFHICGCQQLAILFKLQC